MSDDARPSAAWPAAGSAAQAPPTVSAARRRAAIELISREEEALRRAARRFSLCAEDAEDAYQRALEILLLKAPNERPRDLIRWTTTVVKHEALKIRGQRERLLGRPARDRDGEPIDRVAHLPARGAGPAERVERKEGMARSREALRTLKPAELRALTLLAAGYSYTEIATETGYSQRKVVRVLAEGRERYRRFLAGSENGRRCAELAPLLSAHCDGETGVEQGRAVREHLRACPACRAAMRAYRATPSTVAALAPALPLARPLLERAQETWIGLWARLPGGSAETGLTQAAAGGAGRGAGMAAMAKLLAVCAGTAGGACVATGVTPLPLDLAPRPAPAPRVQQATEPATAPTPAPTPVSAPAGTAQPPQAPEPEPVPQTPEAPPAEAGAVEYAPPPPAPVPPPTPPGAGTPAGEFGP